MALQGQLASIPFGALIGGPLNAAIQAQANAAISTVEFIKNVGFDKDNKVTNVTFKYGEEEAEQTLKVPLLTIVPIPFIRIDDMSINFKASMSQSNETESIESSSVSKEAKLSGSASYWFVKVNMSGSVSSKKDSSSTQNSKYAVEYTIDVNVHAVQDDMPAGMSKILNILAESIERQQEKVQPAPKVK
jgi:hypothetical protein